MIITTINRVTLLVLCLTVLSACSLRSDESNSNLSENPNTNLKPVARISPTDEQFVFINETISFSADNSFDNDDNTPLSYQWTFSGATTSTLQSSEVNPPNILFSSAGIVSIRLVVTDSEGLSSDPTTVIVNVDPAGSNRAPNGSIKHDQGNGNIDSTGNITISANSIVKFIGSGFDADGDNIRYAWDYDGMTATANDNKGPITVSYPTPGSFAVTLTVSDEKGNIDQSPASLTVTVIPSLPSFLHLPVLAADEIKNNSATYSLNVEENVAVNVVTPDSSWTTPMMRYNAQQLPPLIIAKRGTNIRVVVTNNLATEDTTVHWHGFKIPGSEDGGPDIIIPSVSAAAKNEKVYNFTLAQPAASLWFHPHANHFTATQVYKGLAGVFIIKDDITDTLENNNKIPSGDHDITLLVQDRNFNDPNNSGERSLDLTSDMGGRVAGRLGEIMLVNGVEMPSLEVDTTQYRFRVYNASNARTYDFALADNANFTVIGTDGGLLNTPVMTDHIMLAAGERAEIVINFGKYTPGETINFVSRAFNDGNMMGGALKNGSAFDVMRFAVTTQSTDKVTLYTALPANAEINQRLTASDTTRAIRGFEMMMGSGGGMGGPGGGGMRFEINNKLFDINRVDEIVLANAVEIWDISNTTMMAHPFHAHAIQWQILSRNGVAASGIDLGWKDTVLVQANESIKFIGRFDPVVNTGLYMYHCHILEHEDAGMMGTFNVVAP